MEHERDAELVRRMAESLIVQYREGIDYFRTQIHKKYERMGRIAERLGEPEEESS